MSNEPRDQIIEGHDYDGIQELDNPLPKWWQILFYVTIVFAVGYFAYYEYLGGPTSEQYLQADMQKFAEANKQAQQQKPEDKAVDVNALLADHNALAEGKTQFGQFCVSCHGSKGEGVIGPNLTDDFWIYSKGDYAGITKSFREGYPDKGMPPWKDIIPQDTQPKLAAYVLSLRGTNPPKAKAPQGDKVN